MNAFSLILTICVLAQDPIAAPLPSNTQTQAAPQVSFELIETDSKRVAFIEHNGPYWSLGPVIDQVARDANAISARNALVIRYLDNPVAASPGGLRAEVGFELVGTEMAKPPYKVAQWPRALVARKSVSGPDGLSTRHFASLKAWAQAQGLAPGGDLFALVELAESGESTAIERAEIHLPVCVPDPPVAQAPPTSWKTPEGETRPTEIQEALRPTQAPRIVTKIIQLPVAGPQDKPEADASRPALGTPVQQAREPQLAAPAVQPVTPDPPPVQPSVPVRRWIEEGKFAELAAALLPGNVDSASHQWADQMAARTVALAIGVKKQSPGEEGWLGEFSTQLGDRRDANRIELRSGSRRVIGPSESAASKGADRKALMLELDRLMGNVSYRALSPDQIRENLIELLEKVPPLASP